MKKLFTLVLLALAFAGNAQYKDTLTYSSYCKAMQSIKVILPDYMTLAPSKKVDFRFETDSRFETDKKISTVEPCLKLYIHSTKKTLIIVKAANRSDGEAMIKDALKSLKWQDKLSVTELSTEYPGTVIAENLERIIEEAKKQ